MEFSKDLAYLLGAIYGDGYISNSYKSKISPFKDYKIGIENTNIEYIERIIYPIFKKYTNTNAKIRYLHINNKQPSAKLDVRNKALYEFFTNEIKTFKGKKLRGTKIPRIIKNTHTEFKKEFIAGFFDTDGGFRGKVIGITTKCKDFQEFFIRTLKENNIKVSKEKWFNKRYQKYYYGVRIRKNNIDTFLKTFRLRNKQKFDQIKKRYERVPKWSNGLENNI